MMFSFDPANFITAFESVLVWTDAVVALVGGLICGNLLTRGMFNPRFDALETVILTATGAVFLGLVFFTGQFLATYGREGDLSAWRILARYVMWVVFSFGLAFGSGIYLRRQTGRWRERRQGFRRGLDSYPEKESGDG